MKQHVPKRMLVCSEDGRVIFHIRTDRCNYHGFVVLVEQAMRDAGVSVVYVAEQSDADVEPLGTIDPLSLRQCPTHQLA